MFSLKTIRISIRMWFILGFLFFSAQVRAESSMDNFLEKFLMEVPEDPINPLFRQGMAVQRRALHREGEFILGFQPGIDVNFSPYGNLGMGFDVGYAFSERLELHMLYVPFYFAIKKSVADDMEKLRFTSGGSPDLEQTKKSAEYTSFFHWVPGYGKISFTRDRSYRYDMFLDFILGWLAFKGNGTAKVGLGFGNSIFFSDNFAIRYQLWGSVAQTPDLKSGQSSLTLLGDAQLGLLFYL